MEHQGIKINMAELAALYPLSIIVNVHFSGDIIKVEPHDISDWESPDILWLEHTPENKFSKGVYLSISRLSKAADFWSVTINDANGTGGHPTTWGESGSENELLGKINSCLKQYRNYQ
jgi:hypothetical protein